MRSWIFLLSVLFLGVIGTARIEARPTFQEEEKALGLVRDLAEEGYLKSHELEIIEEYFWVVFLESWEEMGFSDRGEGFLSTENLDELGNTVLDNLFPLVFKQSLTAGSLQNESVVKAVGISIAADVIKDVVVTVAKDFVKERESKYKKEQAEERRQMIAKAQRERAREERRRADLESKAEARRERRREARARSVRGRARTRLIDMNRY